MSERKSGTRFSMSAVRLALSPISRKRKVGCARILLVCSRKSFLSLINSSPYTFGFPDRPIATVLSGSSISTLVKDGVVVISLKNVQM